MSLKIGDRVRITKSVYKAHPSRMRGGTGTIVKLYEYISPPLYGVVVDGGLQPEPDTGWTFKGSELQRRT